MRRVYVALGLQLLACLCAARSEAVMNTLPHSHENGYLLMIDYIYNLLSFFFRSEWSKLEFAYKQKPEIFFDSIEHVSHPAKSV